MKRILTILISTLSILALWQLLASLGDYPAFILPSPGRVLSKAVSTWQQGELARHISTTLYETIAGFGLASILALSLGYLASSHLTLRHLISPYLIALQSIPVLAVAPLMIIWFGNGYQTKVLITAIVAFLPMFFSSLTAFGEIDRTLHQDLRSLGAEQRQIFFKLELPAALPGIFSGLKTSLNLALMGAVVGEFVGATRGLGYLINLGKGLLDTALVFVSIFCLIGLGLILYMSIELMEKILLKLR